MTVTRLSFIDGRALAAAVDGTVVSADSWGVLEDAEQILAQANAQLDKARADARRIRAEAYDDGYRDGRTEAHNELAVESTALARRQHALLGNMEKQVSELALAVVARMAPALGATEVMPALVARAIDAARAEVVLRVRVHPSSLEAARNAVGQLAISSSDLPVEIVGDQTLDGYTCVLETAAGTVRAGWDNQLEAIRAAFALAIGDGDCVD